MPVLLPSPYRAQKPPAGAQIDWSHPLTSRLYMSIDALEQGGTMLRDSTDRFGANLRGTTMPAWVPSYDARFGMVMNFTGAAQSFLQINGALADWRFGTGPFSVEVWFKSTTGDGNLLRADTGLAGSGLLMLRMGSGVVGNLRWAYYTAARAAIVDLTSPLSSYNDGVWHQVIGIRDVVNLKGRIVVDGAQVATAVDTGGSQSTNAVPKLGALLATTELFTGQMASVRVWNRALNLDEARQLYAEPFAMLRGPDRWRRR